MDRFGSTRPLHRKQIVNKRGEGVFLDIVLGIVGAIVGGWLFTTFGASGVTGLNVYSLLVAIVGSVGLLVIYHAIKRQSNAFLGTSERWFAKARLDTNL